MSSSKKIAAVLVLAGGLMVTTTGVTHASEVRGPGSCNRDLLGNISCSQHIVGEVPEDGVIPHYETCTPVQPLTLPAAMGNGTTQLGPKVTCNPATTGAADEADAVLGTFGMPR
ncbi:hypothetical protein ACIP2X_18370 [Streptomyces sp. NPDC089424]|uniref:hypothetical protein n=1 Tax=Streptomyces sp. NPDC089424 TaxID=3365917 RepID=UPI00381768C7